MKIKELEWVELSDKNGKSYLYAVGFRYYYKIVKKGSTLFKSYRKHKTQKASKYEESFAGDLQSLKTSLSQANAEYIEQEIKRLNNELSKINTWVL